VRQNQDTPPGAARRATTGNQLLLAIILCAVLASLLVAYFGSAHTTPVAALCHLFASLGSNPLLAMALAGTVLVHFIGGADRKEILATVVLGLAMFAGFVGLGGTFAPYFGARILAAAAYLGIASALVQVLRIPIAPPAARPARLLNLLAGASLPAFIVLSAPFLHLTVRVHPKTLDPWLYVFDGSLGFQASFAMGRLLSSITLVRNVSFLAYNGLPLAAALFYAVERRQRQDSWPNIILLFIAIGAGGSCLYHLYPASGPIYLFPSTFPFHPPSAASVALQSVLLPVAPRNAIPSLHLSWALVLWWRSAGLRVWTRAVFAFFLVCTAVATLGLGEHYLIDLVVAVPYTMAIEAAFCRKWIAAAAAAAMVFLWLALLRFAIPQFQNLPALSWGLVLATLALALLFRYRGVSSGRIRVS